MQKDLCGWTHTPANDIQPRKQSAKTAVIGTSTKLHHVMLTIALSFALCTCLTPAHVAAKTLSMPMESNMTCSNRWAGCYDYEPISALAHRQKVSQVSTPHTLASGLMCCSQQAAVSECTAKPVLNSSPERLQLRLGLLFVCILLTPLFQLAGRLHKPQATANVAQPISDKAQPLINLLLTVQGSKLCGLLYAP
jgi:hypothetical protein